MQKLEKQNRKTNLVVTFSSRKMERGIKAAESGVFSETWVAI